MNPRAHAMIDGQAAASSPVGSWRRRAAHGHREKGFAPEGVRDRPGAALESPVRSQMERRLGHEFGDVRIHDDAWAHASARAAHAKAYTVGRDVVFGAGQYAPQRDAGQRLLAHELAHTVQQRGALADGHRDLRSASTSAEHEAHAAADASMRGERAPLGRHGLALAREPDGIPSPDAPAPDAVSGADPAADILADPVLDTYRVNSKGKVIGFDIDRISAKVHAALKKSKDAKILVRGNAAPGDDAMSSVDEAAYNVRAALIEWLGKKTFPDIAKRIQYYAGFGLPVGSDKGTVVVTVQGGGVPGQTAVSPVLIQPPGLGGAQPSATPGAPGAAPAAPAGPGLGDMLTIKFKGGPVEFEISLPKSAKAKLPIGLGSARVLSIELSGAATGDFGFAMWLDNTIPAVRVGLKAGVAVAKDKPVMGSAGLVIETTAKTVTAAEPESLKAAILAAGAKLTAAYEAYRVEKDAGTRTEKLIEIASAIGAMYEAIDAATKPAGPVPTFTFEFGGKFPLNEPPVVDPDPAKRPVPYIGGTATFHW